MPKSRLDFPWKAPAAPGEVTEVAKGLLWARLPLPFRLDHVNIWLLEEEDGWTVIDTGCATPEIMEVWERLLEGPMRGKPIIRVVATHGHVDHMGLTGSLVERFNADFMGTFAEWAWARLSHTHDVPRSSDTHHSYLVRNGFDDEEADKLVRSRRRFIDLSSPIPGWITEIRDGDKVRLGGMEWRVIVTRGHAFEHASFYNEENAILIAGDHVLPRISSVIAVYEMTPKGDPLGDYLDSFPQFDGISEGTLILPSHGLPYRGIHQRIAELRDHHRLRLDATAFFLSNPSTALELSRAMFPHIEGPDNIGFALGETLAHVNYLVARNIVEERLDDRGRTIFALRN
jgi:glyoxylase-like metal-dependent hydrolase (beta-lactamase superfamily II)